MVTERYIISFYGIDTKYYTNEFVGKCWEIAADEVYRERQVYVMGSVLTTNIICGEVRGCNLGNTGHVITSVRNPAGFTMGNCTGKRLSGCFSRRGKCWITPI